MATIKKLPQGGFVVHAIDRTGEEVHLVFATHIEAQAIANVETQNQLQYYSEFETVDGYRQHRDGKTFIQWLKSKKWN